MPGGPTDPEVILNAIHAGCGWSSNHLVVAGVDQWPAVDGARWTLSTSPAVLLDLDTYTKLARGTLSRGGFVTVDGLRYQLDSVTVNGSAWAVLQPA